MLRTTMRRSITEAEVAVAVVVEDEDAAVDNSGAEAHLRRDSICNAHH